MGRLTRIEDIVNSTISASHVKIYPRGVQQFVDSLLRGQTRFAKRTGNNIAVANVDNTFKLAKATQPLTANATLLHPTKWIDIDCIVSMGPNKELVTVKDVVDSQLIFNENLTQVYTTNDKVLLHSFPLKAFVDTPAGSTTIQVMSHLPLFNGDVLVYKQTPSLLLSIVEDRASQVVYGGTTADPYYVSLYTLTLDSPLKRDITSGEMLYFRAYPAYYSSTLRVPNGIFSNEQQGPFLFDTLSGRLVEGDNFPETLSIRTLDRTNNYVEGTANSYVTINKNYPIIDRPWSAHYPVFWDLAAGTMRITPDRLVMRTDDNGHFLVGFKCVPRLPQNKQYRVSLRASETTEIRFRFGPYDYQVVPLSAGANTIVIVTIPAGVDPVTDLEINALSGPQVDIFMSDWSPVGPTVVSFEYALVVEATGIATYQSTGIMIKPYFLSTEFLRATYDINGNYDGGKVWF